MYETGENKASKTRLPEVLFFIGEIMSLLCVPSLYADGGWQTMKNYETMKN